MNAGRRRIVAAVCIAAGAFAWVRLWNLQHHQLRLLLGAVLVVVPAIALAGRDARRHRSDSSISRSFLLASLVFWFVVVLTVTATLALSILGIYALAVGAPVCGLTALARWRTLHGHFDGRLVLTALLAGFAWISIASPPWAQHDPAWRWVASALAVLALVVLLPNRRSRSVAPTR